MSGWLEEKPRFWPNVFGAQKNRAEQQREVRENSMKKSEILGNTKLGAEGTSKLVLGVVHHKAAPCDGGLQILPESLSCTNTTNEKTGRTKRKNYLSSALLFALNLRCQSINWFGTRGKPPGPGKWGNCGPMGGGMSSTFLFPTSSKKKRYLSR